MSVANEDEKNRILKWKRMYTRLQAHDAMAVARRTKIFDEQVVRFISNNPRCTVINLACGFDTRFWRIPNKDCRYVELDLPDVVALKRELLEDAIRYELIGCSVLDESWMDQLTANGNSHFLLLAEGLLYYLPRQDALQIIAAIARRFDHSQLIFDSAPVKYTRGIWKWLLRLESRAWGIDVELKFGMKNPRDIESFAPGLKLTGIAKGNVGPLLTVWINAA